MWRRCTGAVVAAAVVWAIAAPPARAGIWTAIPSGTASDITAIEYQPDGRIWFTTAAGGIFTRRPDGAFAETWPASGVRLNDVAFQPGGQVGLAVGNGGQVLRTADGGASWSPVAITARTDAGAPATTCDGLAHPLGDVRAVHFAGSGTAWLAAQGTQLMRSRPASAASVGAAGTWTDANWLGGGSGCRLATTFNEGVADLFVVPSDPAVGWFCGSWLGEVRFTSNGLGSVTDRRGGCGNGASVPQRRLAGDPGNPSRMWAVGPGGANLTYTAMTDDGWASARSFLLGNVNARDLGTPYDVGFAGGTVVAAGDGGMILTSADGNAFWFNGADGPLATAAWRAVGVASATQAAVGGAGGALVVTTRANAAPDLAAPTGAIAGPARATAGQAARYRAVVADEAGGSGVDASSLSWSAPGVPDASGPSATFTFPAEGEVTIRLTFRDNAGNRGAAALAVSVGPGAASAGPPARAEPPPGTGPRPRAERPPRRSRPARTRTGVAVLTVPRRVSATAAGARHVPVRLRSRRTRTFSLRLRRGRSGPSVAAMRVRVAGGRERVARLPLPANAPLGRYTVVVRVLRHGRQVGHTVRLAIVVA